MNDYINSSNLKRCALSGERAVLVKSHIIPNFMFQYIRNTSAGTFFSWADNPNSELKDGWKKELLSIKSESKFGVWEKWSKKHIFVHLWNNPDKFEVNTNGSYFYYFIISVFWRCLYVELEEKKEFIKDDVYAFFSIKEVELRDCLNNDGELDGYIYFLPLCSDYLGSTIVSASEKEWIRGDFSFGIYNEGTEIALYCKCPYCMFFYVLQGSFCQTALGVKIIKQGNLVSFGKEDKCDDKIAQFIKCKVNELKNTRKNNVSEMSSKTLCKLKKMIQSQDFIISEGGKIIIKRLLEENYNVIKKK